MVGIPSYHAFLYQPLLCIHLVTQCFLSEDLWPTPSTQPLYSQYLCLRACSLSPPGADHAVWSHVLAFYRPASTKVWSSLGASESRTVFTVGVQQVTARYTMVLQGVHKAEVPILPASVWRTMAHVRDWSSDPVRRSRNMPPGLPQSPMAW